MLGSFQEKQPIQPERFTPKDTLLYVDAELARIQPAIAHLIEARHRIFEPADTEFVKTIPLVDQLYLDHTYNHTFIKNDLGLRKGLEFHQEVEKYNPRPDDSPKLAHDKATYRHIILDTAHQLGGFISEAPGVPSTEVGKRLGILDNNSEKIDQPVEAIVVASAAGLSSYKRFYDAIRDLESGNVHTNQILFVAGDRPIGDAEKATVAAKEFTAGSTEYESSQRVVEQLLGVAFLAEEHELAIPYGSADLKAKYVSTQAVIGDTLIDIKVVFAPVETGRVMDDGSLAKRTNTQETFLSLQNLLSADPGLTVLYSHDAWKPYQNSMAIATLGMEFGKQVVTRGPFNAERLFFDEAGKVDIHMAEGVVDEIAKCQDDLVTLRIAALNKIAEKQDEHVIENLISPLPDFESLRASKGVYRTLPIDTGHEKFNEPLVTLAHYGIAGQSYYSRPNAATGEAVSDVPPEVKVRQSIAEELVRINKQLENPSITDFFGGEVELYVEEGVRLISVQQDLFDTYMPALVRAQSPDKSEEEVRAHVATIVAKPDLNAVTPTPHQTGGAVDIILRYRQSTPLFVAGSEVPMAHIDGDTTRTNPDFFESKTPTTDADRLAQLNRRAFYNIMTGHAFGITTGLSVNPTEFWHWSRGDQLAAHVSGEPAYYSFATDSKTS